MMTMWIIFNSLLLVFSTVKGLFFMRVNEYFGMLVQLLMQVLIDLVAFIVFFITWIILFCFLYKISGTGVPADDYPHVNPLVYYCIQIFRNSIGDEKTPVYNFWSSRLNTDPLLAKSMIGYSWFLWASNAFFMLILMLNFLIAIVS